MIDKSTAVHETAHAFFTFLLRDKCHWLILVAEDRPFINSRGVSLSGLVSTTRHSSWWQNVEDGYLLEGKYLAGGVAEAIWSGRPYVEVLSEWGCSADIDDWFPEGAREDDADSPERSKDVREMLRMFSGPIRYTAKILKAYWPIIDQMSDILLKQGAMSGEEFERRVSGMLSNYILIVK